MSIRCGLLDVDRVHVVEKKLMIANILFFFSQPIRSISFLLLLLLLLFFFLSFTRYYSRPLITPLSFRKRDHDGTMDSKLFLPLTFLTNLFV